ncbi:hypothetical protein J3459_018160 [Metarhizium acridum]|nr:hypothetical protein J3459_018160 [Metarhizium acridum]
MGATIGTKATSALLDSIFAQLERNRFQGGFTDGDLLIAAADVLAAHIGRDDHRGIVTTHPQEPLQAFFDLTRGLSRDESFTKDQDGNIEDPKLYAAMAALREAVIFGAMHRYNADLRTRNQEHIKILNIFAQAVVNSVATAAGANPSGALGSGLVTATGTALISFANLKLEGSQEDQAAKIDGEFGLKIKDPAKFGVIPGLKNKVDKDISTKEYADRAFDLIQTLKP